MAIITTCLSFIALSMYAIELSIFNNWRNYFDFYDHKVCYSCAKYIQTKNSVGIIGSLFICVLTIVQASFCCKDVCDCCKNASQSGAIVQPPQQSTVVIHQQQTAPSTSYPNQQTYPVQQAPAYPTQPVQSYPAQGYAAYPQPPVQPVYSMPQTQPYGQPMAPPSYQQATAPPAPY